jgi:hypothetical protein
MCGMTKNSALPASLENEYRTLARSLARTGFISRGSVFARERGAGSRYQWSWKNPQQKTLSVTLSLEQYHWLKQAIAREKALEKTLRKMRQLSQRVLLDHIPGPTRRKLLSTKALRVN